MRLRRFCTILFLAIASLLPLWSPASASVENSEITVTIDGRPIFLMYLTKI